MGKLFLDNSLAQQPPAKAGEFGIVTAELRQIFIFNNTTKHGVVH